MKLFKRISSLFLAFAMVITVLGSATAFAAESTAPVPDNATSDVTNGSPIQGRSVGSEITTDYIGALPHAGNYFIAPTNQLYFAVTFYPGNRSVILSVKLHDDTTHSLVQEWQSSTGSITQTVNVTAGHRYVFEYQRAYGTATITGHNTIYSSY